MRELKTHELKNVSGGIVEADGGIDLYGYYVAIGGKETYKLICEDTQWGKKYTYIFEQTLEAQEFSLEGFNISPN